MFSQSMYRSQRDFYQAHRETSNEAQLASIKVFLLYIVQTGSHEKVKLELVLGASIAFILEQTAQGWSFRQRKKSTETVYTL